MAEETKDKVATERYALIDIGTGEVVDTINSNEGFRKIKKSVARANRKDFTFANWKFLKLSQVALPVLMKHELTNTEWSLLWYLCERVRYRSFEIRHSNGMHLRTKGIAEALGVSQSTINRSIVRLGEIGLIKRTDTRPLTIYMNPYFAMKGNAIHKDMTKMFEDTEFYKAYVRSV